MTIRLLCLIVRFLTVDMRSVGGWILGCESKWFGCIACWGKF